MKRNGKLIKRKDGRQNRSFKYPISKLIKLSTVFATLYISRSVFSVPDFSIILIRELSKHSEVALLT